MKLFHWNCSTLCSTLWQLTISKVNLLRCKLCLALNHCFCINRHLVVCLQSLFIQEKQKKKRKEKHFSFEKSIIHSTQHQARTQRGTTNNINNSMETPAAPLSSFKVPEVGDKFINKECIHRYIYDYISFTNRNITQQVRTTRQR